MPVVYLSTLILPSLITSVGLKLGRSNTKIQTYLNDRQKEICRSYNFSFMQKTFTAISTIIGTGSYALPTGFKDDLHVYYLDSNGENSPLEQIDLQTAWEKYGIATTDRGSPKAWSLRATTFDIWPIPDAVYTIGMEGFAYLSPLEDGNNYLTDYWPQILEAGALSDCYAEVGMLEESNYWESKFQKLFKDLRIEDVERSLPGVMILEPRTGPRR